MDYSCYIVIAHLALQKLCCHVSIFQHCVKLWLFLIWIQKLWYLDCKCILEWAIRAEASWFILYFEEWRDLASILSLDILHRIWNSLKWCIENVYCASEIMEFVSIITGYQNWIKIKYWLCCNIICMRWIKKDFKGNFFCYTKVNLLVYFLSIVKLSPCPLSQFLTFFFRLLAEENTVPYKCLFQFRKQKIVTGYQILVVFWGACSGGYRLPTSTFNRNFWTWWSIWC